MGQKTLSPRAHVHVRSGVQKNGDVKPLQFYYGSRAPKRARSIGSLSYQNPEEFAKAFPLLDASIMQEEEYDFNAVLAQFPDEGGTSKGKKKKKEVARGLNPPHCGILISLMAKTTVLLSVFLSDKLYSPLY